MSKWMQCTQRHTNAQNPHLGHGHNVRDHALILEAPVVGACAAEARLYLIRYTHTACLSYHLHLTAD